MCLRHSIGFWVANTVKVSGSWCEIPSTVTRRSCMASSSAACVLAGARLISSPRMRSPKMGPGRKVKLGSAWPPRNTDAGDIGRHEIRRELDPPEVETERLAQRADEQRLRRAGHPFEQHVTSHDSAATASRTAASCPSTTRRSWSTMAAAGWRHGRQRSRCPVLQSASSIPPTHPPRHWPPAAPLRGSAERPVSSRNVASARRPSAVRTASSGLSSHARGSSWPGRLREAAGESAHHQIGRDAMPAGGG